MTRHLRGLGRQAMIAGLCLTIAAAATWAETSSGATRSSTPGTGDIVRTGTSSGTTSTTSNTSTRPDPTTATSTSSGTSRTTSSAPPVTARPPTPPTSAPPPNPARDGSTANPGTPNPGDFASDVAHAEAERAIGAPLPVVRLDKPEFVFSSADPEVAAGVQAWLGTLQGPHDKYGNFMGPGFKGSFRPDSVNKQLVAFLATYLAGKRLVAVDAGQASGLAAAQLQSRAAAIDNIVKAKRDAASRAATPPGTGTGNRENVPRINNGSDGRGGSQTSTGTTTRTTGTSPAAGPSKASTSPAGSQSGAPKTASAIELKYPGVKISSDPKPFTTAELGYLDDALSKLPNTFYAKTQIQRNSVISVNGNPDPMVFGVTKTGAEMPLSVLELSDRSFSDKADDRVDFPSPPYSTEDSKKLQFESTIAHELTHRFLRFNPGDKFYADIATNPLLSGTDGWAAKFGWTYDPTKQSWAMDPTRRKEAPTRYAMEDNPNEDMAESVMLYVYDPVRLRTASPERYAFIRDQLKVPEQSDASTTYPPPKNDPRYASLFAAK